MLERYANLEEGGGSCCPRVESVERDQETRCWNRLWKKYAGGTAIFAVGTVTHYCRFVDPKEVGKVLNASAYVIKVLALPLLVCAIVDAKRIDRDRARDFIKDAKHNVISLLVFEALIGTYRELGMDKNEGIIAVEVLLTLTLAALFYRTLKKFRPESVESD